MIDALRTTRDLQQLMPELGAAAAGVRISDLTIDSRAVVPGSLFLACAGRSTHGLRHASSAIAQGARAVLFEPTPGVAVPELAANVFCAPVSDLAQQLGSLAARFFGEPSASMSIAGVTGTNGKTTCAWLLAGALQRTGRPSGYIGTIGVGMAGDAARLAQASHTTSDAVTVQRTLADLRDAGAQCVAMEVSSHALDQGRIDGVRMRVAAFTNLTRDHLDYHGSMEAYAAAKARLFTRAGLAARVINVDDSVGADFAGRRAQSGRLIVTARTTQGIALAKELARTDASVLPVLGIAASATANGLLCKVQVGEQAADLPLRLIGDFNIDNALTVLGMMLALDVPLPTAIEALSESMAPPGRLEPIAASNGVLAVVDYAHTPDALAKAVQATRTHGRGRLTLVFGCGGDRDAGKRPLMALAATAADEIIVTDDNPRSESPQEIVAQILAGLPANRTARVVHDRAAAIRTALRGSGAGDVVLIAGKGHESYQIYGDEKRPFSDQAVVREVLA